MKYSMLDVLRWRHQLLCSNLRHRGAGGSGLRSDVHATLKRLTKQVSFQPPRFEGRQRVAVGDEWRQWVQRVQLCLVARTLATFQSRVYFALLVAVCGVYRIVNPQVTLVGFLKFFSYSCHEPFVEWTRWSSKFPGCLWPVSACSWPQLQPSIPCTAYTRQVPGSDFCGTSR